MHLASENTDSYSKQLLMVVKYSFLHTMFSDPDLLNARVYEKCEFRCRCGCTSAFASYIVAAIRINTFELYESTCTINVL